MLAPTISFSVREVGGFWALCREGRRHRVTAHRVTKRPLNGRAFQAYTRLTLTSGSEVRWIRDGTYRADQVGILLRVNGSELMA